MRKFRLMLFVVLLVALAVTALAEDYDKGDYKILALGDSRDMVQEKVDYLVETGGLKGGNNLFAYTEIAGEKFTIYLSYYNDLLYRMSFYSEKYNAMRVDTYLKGIMMDKIKPMFAGVYGNPIDDYGYPAFFDLKDGYINFICRWKDGGKEITIGVSSGDFEYQGVIWMIDTALEAQKEKDEEEAAKNKALESARDF